MRPRTYRGALDNVLTPEGFVRDGSEWIRTRGDMWESVDLQVSTIAGTTANLVMKDLETERMLGEALGVRKSNHINAISIRIGNLINGFDRWWRQDPNGPAELSQALVTYGLPYFDRVKTLEEQAARWYGRGGKRWHGKSLICLAITLYRMGELDEACAELSVPTPRTAIPAAVANVQTVRRWLGCERADAGASKP